MSSTTRLNKTQKYAINWLNSIGKDGEEIAKELKLKIAAVENYIKKNTQQENTPTDYSKTKPKECIARFKNTEKNKSHTLKMMLTETAGKKQNSVCIMTKEASSLSDKR